jgi:hypothetical protein
LTRIFENAGGYFAGSRYFGVTEAKVQQTAALDKGSTLGGGKLWARIAQAKGTAPSQCHDCDGSQRAF